MIMKLEAIIIITIIMLEAILITKVANEWSTTSQINELSIGSGI
jgi:hypothetical protein